jgi:hypothetical protein
MYYINDFRIKEGANGKSKNYSPKEVKDIFQEYEKLKINNTKIREEALSKGKIDNVAKLEDKITKLQTDYEFKRLELKKAQIKIEKKLTETIDQLNTEYFTYKNAPADTAIIGRDYELKNIKTY